MLKQAISPLRLRNYSQLDRKNETRPTFATSQQLVAASVRMVTYIQTNDLVTDYWFAGDLDAHVNEA